MALLAIPAAARRVALAGTLLCGCIICTAPAVGDDPGRPRGLTSREGSGTLTALPPVVQPGSSPLDPPVTDQLVATFRPVRPGRTVILQRDTRRGWRIVDSAHQDRYGSAAFDVRPGLYRAEVLATRHEAAVTTAPVATVAWRTTFEDTFVGDTLDMSVWNDQLRQHESVWAARTCARSDPAARRVGGGVLHLGIAPDPGRAGEPCSYVHPDGSGIHDYLVFTQVATEHTRLFRHGVFAARMRLQRARGMHSAFWMLPRDREFKDSDPSGGTEIDVVEYFGERPSGRDTITSSIHYYDPGGVVVSHGGAFRRARRVLETDQRWWDGFHVFSVEWTPEEYVFRVDGREYYRQTEAVSLAESYLVLSMQAFDYELGDLTRDEYDDTARVDWVRVYDTTGTPRRD